MIPASHLLTAPAATRRAPMPVDAPPVGRARARRLRLLQLRESTLGRESHVEADALAETLVRRGEFTRRLAARLADELRAERAVADRREAV